MCLAIPGKIVEILDEDSFLKEARVQFGGITKKISLAYTPEAQVGEYIIAHVGFAISKIEEEEANKTIDYLEQLRETKELTED